jgi:hypothetical protein
VCTRIAHTGRCVSLINDARYSHLGCILGRSRGPARHAARSAARVRFIFQMFRQCPRTATQSPKSRAGNTSNDVHQNRRSSQTSPARTAQFSPGRKPWVRLQNLYVQMFFRSPGGATHRAGILGRRIRICHLISGSSALFHTLFLEVVYFQSVPQNNRGIGGRKTKIN